MLTLHRYVYGVIRTHAVAQQRLDWGCCGGRADGRGNRVGPSSARDRARGRVGGLRATNQKSFLKNMLLCSSCPVISSMPYVGSVHLSPEHG